MGVGSSCMYVYANRSLNWADERINKWETIVVICAALDKQLRTESLAKKKKSTLNGILIYDLCDTGALLYQLS